MLNQGIVVLLALVLTANSIHLHQHDNLYTGSVKLVVSDVGQYLSVCNQCGESDHADSAVLSNIEDVWSLEVVNGQVAFKGVNGKYLARCEACWENGAYDDAVFVYAD